MLSTTTKGDALFHFSKVMISMFKEERDIAHQCVMKKETAKCKYIILKYKKLHGIIIFFQIRHLSTCAMKTKINQIKTIFIPEIIIGNCKI